MRDFLPYNNYSQLVWNINIYILRIYLYIFFGLLLLLILKIPYKVDFMNRL